MKKIINLPSNYQKRRRIDANNFILRCEKTQKWIQFANQSQKGQITDFLKFDIMTIDKNKNKKKLCTLTIDRNTLIKIIEKIPHKNI
ncbi:hypothetical protein [Marinicella sp. W31]|uniref:hypothetical protein n=1 Tax=Marinicella sp. W31 TaxID=3023713 RepID=UPI0037567438